MRTKIFMLIMSLFAFNLMGCTRAAKDVAKLNLSIASSVDGNGALASTMQLTHVSINVTGAGIAAPIIYTWDGCRDCSNPPPTPTSFQLTVPSGTGRLVQILAVYEDPDTSKMNFYYGDVNKDLTAAEDTAAINVASVGSGTITDGRVAGRYFNTTSGGPTGLIDIKYNPGNGKPSLIVDNGVIINGWFSLFMLSGANLQYVVRDTGEVLWGQEMSLESAQMDPSESSGAYFNQRVRAFVPVHIEARSESGGVTVYRYQDAETYVWGYWGPGAVGKRVCTSGVDGSPTPQRLKQYVSASPETAPALNVSHLINWNLSVPTKAQLIDTTTPYASVVFQGGVSMSTNCDTFADTFANQFTNFQKVTLDQIDGNGGDATAGFSGIFRNVSTNMFANVSNGDPKVITGSILPGVDEVFNGLRLFKRPTSDDFRLEIAFCNQLASQGFVAGSATDATLSSSGTFTLTSNITTTEGISGVSAVICPVKSGILAPLGVFMSKWNFNMGGGNMGGAPATKLALIAPQKTVGTGTIVNNLCTPMTIEARTANENIGSLPGMSTINLGSTDGNTAFYNNSGCSGPITSIQTGSSNVTVFVQRTVSGAGSSTLSASTAGLTTSTSTISFVDAPGTVTPKININIPNTISAHECYPLSFESWHSNLYLVNFYDAFASQSFTLNLLAGADLGYYYSGDCSGGTYTTATLGPSPVYQMFFKYTGSATSLNIQPTSITPTSPILTSDFVGGNNITVVQPGAATTMDFMVPTYFEEGQCQTITLRSTDSNGRTSPTTAALTVNLSTTLSGGTFYMYSGCTTPISSISYPASTSMQTVYFMTTSTGSGTFTASSTSPSFSVTRNAVVNPATFSQILIELPGQSYSSGAITGSPNSLPQNVPSSMTIYLVKYDGQIDTTANGNLLTNASATGGVMGPYNSVNFVNGVATTTITPDASNSPISINISAGMRYGYTTVPSTYPAATMLNLYMSNSAALAPGGCQIFAVIPENSDGAALLMSPTNYTISADNGGVIYTDATCSTVASGSQVFNTSSRITALYFKQPSNSTASTITVTPNNGLISTPLTVSTNAATLGSASSLMITGRFTPMRYNVCQPYLVSVADSTGNSVVIGADQAVTIGSNYGYIDDASCDIPVNGGPTNITTALNYAEFYLLNMIGSNVHNLNASGSPLTSGTASVTPNP